MPDINELATLFKNADVAGLVALFDKAEKEKYNDLESKQESVSTALQENNSSPQLHESNSQEVFFGPLNRSRETEELERLFKYILQDKIDILAVNLLNEVPKMANEQLIKDIRKFEANHGLKPSFIQLLDGKVSITIDKSVLYRYKPEQKSGIQRFWSWLNDSDTSFKPEVHAEKLANLLNQESKEEDPDIQVFVKKRYKQLPIPYFSIPIPVENTGTKLRDFNNLATIKIKVKVIFPNDYSSADAIKKLLKAAITSDSENDLPTAARRVSWNPIKRILHAMSALIPHNVAQRIYQALPPNLLNRWIKTTRPNEWGTDFCEANINEPFINSGALATLSNLVLTPLSFGLPAMHVLVNYDDLYDSPNLSDRCDNTYPTSCNTFVANRFSFYAQSRSKIDMLRPNRDEDDYSFYPRNPQGLIDAALQQSFPG